MNMDYITINTQEDLENLNNSVCWDDSELVDAYISRRQQSYFPKDIQYSGYNSFHYHCLYEVCSAQKSHLELIFIGTELIDHHKTIHMALNGRVISGGGVELENYKSDLTLKCAKIIYRFVELEDYFAPGYFLKPGIMDYPIGELNTEGYFHLSNDDNHLLFSETDNGIEITIYSKDDKSNSIKLTNEQSQEVADIICQSLRKH